MLLLPAFVGVPEVNRVYHIEALTLLKAMGDASVDLIATDPPYNIDKVREWDKWPTDAAYIEWLHTILAQFKRILKPNGSLYLFAAPRLAARVEVAVSEHFNVLNNIRWVKQAGWHNKTEKEALRSYLQPWEAVIFAEQSVSDGQYATAEYALNGVVFKPLKDWFRERVKLHSIGLSQLNAALGAATNGGGLASGYFGDKVEFQLPTEIRYAQMQSAFPDAFNREYEELRSEYEELRSEYEELRSEYEELRRPFNVTPFDSYTDVWNFAPVQPYDGKHPCEKPLTMMEHIIKASSKPDAVVLDCFCGSGATLDAASRLGRQYIGGDFDAHWVAYARKRVSLPYTPLMFAA